MLHQSPDQKLYLTSISQILKTNYSYTKTQKFPPSSIHAQIPRLINMPFTPLSLGKNLLCFYKKNPKNNIGGNVGNYTEDLFCKNQNETIIKKKKL